MATKSTPCEIAAVLLLFLAVDLTDAAPPSLQLVPQKRLAWQGQWRAWPQGNGFAVKVVENRAYVAVAGSGLAVFDVSSPTNCVLLGGYKADSSGSDLEVSGHYVYMAGSYRGL